MPQQLVIKSSSLMYIFDFDGTLAGADSWTGFLSSTIACFRQLHFNPNELDIRWAILTSRPKIDRPLINMACNYHKLYPSQIFMGPTFTWKFKNSDQESKYKEKIIKGILDGEIKVNYTEERVDKVFYIDNNERITTPLNQNRGNYKYLAISISDFITKNFYEVIL